MKLKLKKMNIQFELVYFGLMAMTLLIAITLFRYNDYTLQLPGDNVFANITFGVVIISGIVFYFLFKLFEKKNIKLEYLYLVLIIPLGIMYCIANPLGKIPDEHQHARKSYMISQGVFFAEKDENNKPIGMFNTKINELVTKTVNSYEESFSRVASKETTEEIPLNYSMATYAPICHLPQALGMFLTRIFGGGISVQCYAARIFNLIVASLLMFWAIKIIPFKKSIVCFLGLLPITISEFASMSSDALAISGCIFYISYILYLAYDKNKEKISKKDIAILGVSSFVVSLCKIVYIPLCLLLFTIPKEKFNSKKLKYIIEISIFVGAVIINLLWLGYAATFLDEVNPGVDAGAQVKYIITHPLSYVLILFRTIHIYNQTFIMSLCGEGMGNYNAQASVLFTLPCVVLASAMFFVNDDKERENFSFKTKLLYTFIFSGIVVLIYTSLYVAWTSLESPLILGVQARYFLPVLLLTAIIFDNKKIVFNDKFKNKYMMSFMLFMNLNVLSSLTFTYIFNYIIEYYVK